MWVAARVQFDDESTVRQVTNVCTEIEEQMRERVPELSQVFLDPTDVGPEESRRTGRRLNESLTRCGSWTVRKRSTAVCTTFAAEPAAGCSAADRSTTPVTQLGHVPCAPDVGLPERAKVRDVRRTRIA